MKLPYHRQPGNPITLEDLIALIDAKFDFKNKTLMEQVDKIEKESGHSLYLDEITPEGIIFWYNTLSRLTSN